MAHTRTHQRGTVQNFGQSEANCRAQGGTWNAATQTCTPKALTKTETLNLGAPAGTPIKRGTRKLTTKEILGGLTTTEIVEEQERKREERERRGEGEEGREGRKKKRKGEDANEQSEEARETKRGRAPRRGSGGKGAGKRGTAPKPPTETPRGRGKNRRRRPAARQGGSKPRIFRQSPARKTSKGSAKCSARYTTTSAPSPMKPWLSQAISSTG